MRIIASMVKKNYIRSKRNDARFIFQIFYPCVTLLFLGIILKLFGGDKVIEEKVWHEDHSVKIEYPGNFLKENSSFLDYKTALIGNPSQLRNDLKKELVSKAYYLNNEDNLYNYSMI